MFANSHSAACNSLSFSPVNHLLLCSAGEDCKIKFYDIQEARIVKTINTDTPLTSLSFNGDGHTIAVGTILGPILIYDLRNSAQVKLTLNGHSDIGVKHLEFWKTS
jgi:WD40 repeat protein